MTTPLRPHPDRARRRRRWRSRWAPARRSAPGSRCNENSASGLGNAFAARRRVHRRRRARCGANPAALSKFHDDAGRRRASTSSRRRSSSATTARCRRPTSRSAATAATPAATTSCRTSTSSVPINPQWAFGLGVNAPFGLDDRVRRRLARPLPGAQVEDQDDQRQPGAVVEGDRPLRDRRRRRTTSTSRRRSPTTSTIRARCSRRRPAAGRHRARIRRPFNAIARPTAGLDSKRDDQRRRRRVGLEHRHRCGTSTPQLRARRELPLRDQVQRRGQRRLRQSRRCRAAAGTLAAVAGRSPARRRRQQPGAVQRRRHLGHQAAGDRQLLDASTSSNDQWDLMADVQWTGWSSIPELTFTRDRRLRCCSATPENLDDAWRVAVGANYRYNDQWKFRGGVAFDQTPVNDTDRTRGCRTPTAGGSRSARSTSATPNCKFDAGFAYIFADSPSFNQNAGQHRRQRADQGQLRRTASAILSVQATYTF